MTKDNYNYPNISDKLIRCLKRDYPNILPENQLNDFELGRLIGQEILQKVLFQINQKNILVVMMV